MSSYAQAVTVSSHMDVIRALDPAKLETYFGLVAACTDIASAIDKTNRGYPTVAAILVPNIVRTQSIMACNDIPREFHDEYCNVAKGQARPGKFVSMGHAEGHLISTAGRRNIATYNATVALNWFPCLTCAVTMVQAGVSTVVGNVPDYDYKPDQYAFREAEDYLISKGVRVIKLNLKEGWVIDHARHQIDT